MKKRGLQVEMLAEMWGEMWGKMLGVKCGREILELNEGKVVREERGAGSGRGRGGL